MHKGCDELINKLIKNKNHKLSEKEGKFRLTLFFKLIEDVNINEKLIPVKNEVKTILKENINHSLINGKSLMELNEEDIIFLYTVFIFKSMINTSLFEKEYEFSYVSIDSILSSFIEYEQKFWIFYYEKELGEIYILKRNLFKLYIILVDKDIFFEKKEFKNNKNNLYLSLGSYKMEWIIHEKIKCSTSPFRLIKIDWQTYQISSFFADTTSSFKENIGPCDLVQLNEFKNELDEFIEKGFNENRKNGIRVALPNNILDNI